MKTAGNEPLKARVIGCSSVAAISGLSVAVY